MGDAVTTARRADGPGGAGDVDVWLLSPGDLDDGQLAMAHALLTAEERERYRKFVFERHRREYLVTRGLLRAALSRHRPVERAAWQFRRNEYGRPELDPPCGLRFNLSNHPSLVACAVREGELELGCDLEPLDRGAEVLGLADTVFAPRELAELRALPAAAQPERALSLWTLKESYIKARSMGLSLPLKGFAFSFDGAAPCISFTAELPDEPARWRFAMLDVGRHRISLAIERDPEQAAGRPAATQQLRVWRLADLDEHAGVTRVARISLVPEA